MLNPRRLTPLVLSAFALFPLAAARAQQAGPADSWPHWRGPHFNGSSAAAKNLPDNLDPKNAAWTVDMPGPSAGTPIVFGDRLFLTGFDARSSKLLAMCLSRKDGRVLWQKEVGDGLARNQRNNMASPSPVTDGKVVVFYYASGDLAAFDPDGNPKWQRNLVKDFGPFNYQWIYGSSTTLYKGKLYVQVLHRDHPVGRGRRGGGGQEGGNAESYLLAIDPETGKDVWRHVRRDEAVEESKESYGTPIPFEHGGKSMLLVIGGDCVTAHDPETGNEIWRIGGWNPQKIGHWRIVPSVVTGAGLAFASPPKGGPLFAMRPDGRGDVTKTHIAWKSEDWTTDVCVPLFYENDLFVLDGDKKKIGRLDPKTGKEKWAAPLDSRPVFRASPTGADGKIYCMNEGGEVWVLSAADGKVLYKGELAGESGPSRASIATVDGQVFVRTADKLYCFQK